MRSNADELGGPSRARPRTQAGRWQLAGSASSRRPWPWEGPCRVVALALSTSRAWQGHRCSRPAHGAAPQVSGSPRSARGGSIDSAAAAASVACAAPPDRPWAPSATRRYSRAVHCGLASWVERVPCRLGMYRSRSGPFVPRAHGLWSHMSESARPRVWHGASHVMCIVHRSV